MKKHMISLFMAVLVGIFLFNTAGLAAESSDSSVSMDAKVIGGTVYVKASSMVKTLGGKGTYDADSSTFHYEQNTIPDIIKKVSPSVVAVVGRPENTNSYQQVDRFNLAHGTGVILSKDGWIVTNAHVVDGMKGVTVLANGGKQYSPQIIYMDKASDIAVMKIKANQLQPATFADSDKVQVGEKVIAIGTPLSFALKNSATVGVISGVNRAVESNYRLLQTDAAINPGNSGGPLLNTDGKIIGINSMKFVGASVDSTGFSIPSNTVQHVVRQLEKYGEVKRASLGFSVEESWEAVIGLSTDKPLIVSQVNSDSAAAKAGIQEGDLLYSVDGQNISTLVDLNEKLMNYMPGDKVKITLLSNGDLLQKTIVLQKQPVTE